MSGVTVGKGSIIGAQSVVAKDVPPYSIFVGNKVIKKRFSEDIIAKLVNIDFKIINHSMGDDYQKLCQEIIDDNNIDMIINSFCEVKG